MDVPMFTERLFGDLNILFKIVAVILLIIIYSKWKCSYFERNGIKCIPYSIPFIGNMFRVMQQKEHMLDLVTRIYNAFPDQKYVGEMIFTRPLIIIKDLELIKQIGIKSFDNFTDHNTIIDDKVDTLFGNHLFVLRGDKWKDMRSTLSPAFTSSKMRSMFEFVTEAAEQMTQYYTDLFAKLDDKHEAVLEVEMKDAFLRYTNDVIASCAFGIKTNSLTHENNDFFKMVTSATDFSGGKETKFFLLASFPKLMRMLRVNPFRQDVKYFFRDLVMDTMNYREKEGVVRQDMIHLLMEAKKGRLRYAKDLENEEDVGFATVDEANFRNWSDDELIAQAFIFFVAGFESSSTVLGFTMYELAFDQEVQKRLQEEVDRLYEEKNGVLEYDDLSKMKYMDMVVSEVLRLWPPASFTDRDCMKSYQLPPADHSQVHGYTVKPGEGVLFPIYSIQRDPKHFPEPDKFDPERFSEENKHKIHPQSYLPFGIGPRNCIGLRFALMQMKAVLFYMVANFNFIQIPKTERPIKIKYNAFVLKPANGIWVGVKPRRG